MTETLTKKKMTDDELADWLASDEFANLPAGEPIWNPIALAMIEPHDAGDHAATKRAVANARAAGWSWGGIGGALELSPREAEILYG